MDMHIWPDKPDRVSSAHFKRPHNIENSWYMAILPFWGKLIIVKVRCHELYAIIKFTTSNDHVCRPIYNACIQLIKY